ncbi:MAG: hypothetical protein K6C97_06730 [Treponema sp.]|nr:hypothetical protein [Treponema sp.]
MNKYIKIASAFVFLITLFLLSFFKSIPSGKLWQEYKVLYVPVQVEDYKVITALNESKISDYVALSNQFLPLNLKSDSLEYSMFKINCESKDYSYYKDRNAYFFDKSQSYRLYYIPSEYEKELNDCLDLLNSNNIEAATDANSTYPWILPLIILTVIIILSLFSKNKLLFILASVPSFTYIFSNPFYPLALAVILLELCLFFISNIWARKGAFLVLLQHYYIPGMLAIALICALSISIKTFALFICTLLSICSALFSYYSLQEYLSSKKSFVPVYIKSAKMLPIFALRQNIVMISLISSSVLLITVFLLTSTKSFSTAFTKLQLPAAQEKACDELPQLENYYQFVWKVESYPYQSLNKNNYSQGFLEFSQYSEEGGFINENKILKAYNQNYKDNVFDSIDTLHFNSIEKVLKSEGSQVQTNYCSVNNYQTNLFSKIMMLICLFVLLFLYFSIIIRRQTRI